MLCDAGHPPGQQPRHQLTSGNVAARTPPSARAATIRALLLSCLRTAYLSRSKRAEERTRTADLKPLRVIGRVLQGFAQTCNSRIDKPISFLCLALCCTVLRPRWCQSGVKRLPLVHSRSLFSTSALSIRSASSQREGDALSLDRYHVLP